MEKEKGKKIGLLKNLAFAPEAREDGKTSEPVEGRFRYFLATFRRNNGLLMLMNLLFIVTLLPLLALTLVLIIMGAEELSYRLHGVTELPYFLSFAGMGYGSSSDVIAAKLDMLDVYSWFFLFAGVAMFFVAIGLAGVMHVCVKFIWQDTFVTKKDNYGNDVPRVVVEFFRGIKKYWWQMLIVGVFLFVLVAGAGNAYVYFVGSIWAGTAGAGEWILVIVTSLAVLFGSVFCMFLLPMIVMYDIGFDKKMRNAAILTLQMPLQNIFLFAITALPFVLIAVVSGFFNVLIVALLLVFGCPFYCLMYANYTQYFAEKIITPVYNAQISRSKKNKKLKK